MVLQDDLAFTELVSTVSAPVRGDYESAAGEVRYLALDELA